MIHNFDADAGQLGTQIRTLDQWQAAADSVAVLLALDFAQIVPAGQKVNVKRCQAVLKVGETWGIRPTPDVVERWAQAVVTKRGGVQ